MQNLANELKAHEELHAAVMAAASAKYAEEQVPRKGKGQLKGQLNGQPCFVPTGKCDQRNGVTDDQGKCKHGSTKRASFKTCANR